MSYKVDIAKALSRFGKNGTENPDAKHNTGRMLGEAFLWDEVMRYAKAKSEAAWDVLKKEQIIPDKKTLLPGDYELAYSPSFTVTAKVTRPVERFNADELATLLAQSKYKIPVSVTKEMIDKAKVPTNSVVTIRIIERT